MNVLGTQAMQSDGWLYDRSGYGGGALEEINVVIWSTINYIYVWESLQSLQCLH